MCITVGEVHRDLAWGKRRFRHEIDNYQKKKIPGETENELGGTGINTPFHSWGCVQYR